MEQTLHSEHWYDQEGNLVSKWTKGAYPSVNTILDVYRDPDIRQFAYRYGDEADERLRELADRGTRVQQAIDLFHKGNARYRAHLEEDDEPFVDGYLSWLERHGFTIIQTEMFVMSQKYKFAGRIDALAYDTDGAMFILDNKTGMPKVRHGLQLKGYQQAFFEMTGKRARMAGVYLTSSLKAGYRFSRKDGYVEYREPWTAFEAHLKLFRYWQRKSKTKPLQDTSEVFVPRMGA